MPKSKNVLFPAFAGAAVFAASQAAACANYDAVVAAVQTDDAPAAATLYRSIEVDAACDDALRDWVGAYLARDRFLHGLTKAGTETEKRAAFGEALRYETHWRSIAEIGRLDWQAGDYRNAAEQFQLAINELAEGDPLHTASEAEIREIYNLAVASLALSDQPVAAPATRSGTAGGVFQTKIRGFVVEEVPLPITFRFDSAEFDEKGRFYAQALADHLLQQDPAQVTLTGHTDPLGEEDYNLELSEKRAAAVAVFLAESGFSGEVEVQGLGEQNLPDPPQGIAAGSEEHYRLARRVSLGQL
ncbi:MAG: OmpA family protein [Pseudomonadota bacterium]